MSGMSGMSGAPNPATQLVEMPARRLALVRTRVAVSEMAQAQRTARAALAAAGLESGPRLTLWRRCPDGVFDYAPGIELAAGAEAPAVIELFELPASRAAFLAFRGGYDGLGAAWGRLFADCAALGVEPAGWALEVYAAEGEVPGADLYATIP